MFCWGFSFLALNFSFVGDFFLCFDLCFVVISCCLDLCFVGVYCLVGFLFSWGFLAAWVSVLLGFSLWIFLVVVWIIVFLVVFFALVGILLCWWFGLFLFLVGWLFVAFQLLFHSLQNKYDNFYSVYLSKAYRHAA